MTNWISLEKASKHLGIGKAALCKLAKEKKIPANRVHEKWVFDEKKLGAWVRANQPIESFFVKTKYNIKNNQALREPQREAYLSIYDYFKKGGKRAIVQVPVGCGKSGLAALLPFGIANGRVLIISPNIIIKEGLFDTFDITNRQKCFWRMTNVLENEDMIVGPFACTLEDGNVSICEKSHLIITNIHQLATNEDKWLNKFKNDFFDLIIVDEGHHSAAISWEKVFKKFPDAKIVHMTATPFRSDRQEIKGDLVYKYSFRNATLKGYIKRLRASYVAPSELVFNYKGDKKNYTLEDVLKLKEKDWFSKGIALSEVCNKSIVDNSLEKLEDLRQAGTNHQLIAVACSIDHAKSIRSLYSERGFKCEVIHSNLSKEEKIDIIQKLKGGVLDCIVQVQMLGEGFDHQKLSVAAIFRPFRSLAPYIQFVGRIMRVIVQQDPTHPDNYGHIVTHSGMNLDTRLKEFKMFERDDQKFWNNVISGEEPEPPREVKSGEARMKMSEHIFAEDEIADYIFEEDFTTVEDEHIIKELEKRLELLGLDPRDAKKLLLKNKKSNKLEKKKAAEPFSVSPQNEWRELKKRLNEQVTSKAKVLLNRVNLKEVGKEIPFKYTTLGISAINNYIASLIMINGEIKDLIKKEKRNAWTNDEFKKAKSELPKIVEKLVRKIKKAQNIYEKGQNTNTN